jgi:DnaJ-class molecular chaperone
MPCYRCGTRQVDPERGESQWKRGVRAEHQVLVCPGCQGSGDWTADLDHCRRCAGAHLVRRLDEVECRDCGLVCPAGAAEMIPARGPGDVGDPDLAVEVERALDRVLGRSRAWPVALALTLSAGARCR